MRLRFVRFALVGMGIASAMAAHAVTLTFDDLSDGTFTTQYSGFGVSSSGTAEVWGGLGNGDPGNWGLFGTNGSKFLGNNGSPGGYITDLNFSSALSGISFDISRSNGSDAADTWQARIYDSSTTLIGSQSGGFSDINTWTSVLFNQAGISRLEIETFGTGFHPYGVDNVNLAPVPEPASMAAIGLGLAALLRRKRRA